MRLHRQEPSTLGSILFTLFVFSFVTWAMLAILEATCKGAEGDCYRATCRIEMGDRSGSGCIFRADDEKFYILTNAHVAGTRGGVGANVVFCREGHEGTIHGRTEWGVLGPNGVPDVAIVSVDRESLGGYEPPIVPLSSDGALSVGDTLLSVGAANGAWLTGWTGHVVASDDQAISFRPAPAGGRSGSAVFNSTGTEIVGLVTWRVDGGYGRAQSLRSIVAAMHGGDGRVQSAEEISGASLTAILPCQMGPDCPDCRRGGRMPQGHGVDPGPSTHDPWPNLRKNRPPTTPPTVTPVDPVEPSMPAVKGCECNGKDACKCDSESAAKLEAAIAALVLKMADQGVSLVDLSKRLDALGIKVEANAAIAVDLSTRIDGIKTGGNAIVSVEPSSSTPGGLVLLYEDGSSAEVQLPPIRVRQIDRDGNVVTNEQGQREEMNVWLGQNLNLRYRNVDDAQVEALEDRVRDLEAR